MHASKRSMGLEQFGNIISMLQHPGFMVSVRPSSYGFTQEVAS